MDTHDPTATTPPTGSPADPTQDRPDRVGEASEESFPASDAPAWGTSRSRAPIDPIQQASEESFPASDSPSWNPVIEIGPPARHDHETPRGKTF